MVLSCVPCQVNLPWRGPLHDLIEVAGTVETLEELVSREAPSSSSGTTSALVRTGMSGSLPVWMEKVQSREKYGGVVTQKQKVSSTATEVYLASLYIILGEALAT